MKKKNFTGYVRALQVFYLILKIYFKSLKYIKKMDYNIKRNKAINPFVIL